MIRLKIGWTATAVAVCLIPLSQVLSGCTSGTSGGPTSTTSSTPRPTSTPSGTPSSTPTTGFTPAPTPNGTPIASNLVGSYSGTFNLPAFQETGRTLSLQVSSKGEVLGTVALSTGGLLALSGAISTTGNSITISGPAKDLTSGKEITITLTGSFAAAGGTSLTGSGTVRDSESDTGSWNVKKTA